MRTRTKIALLTTFAAVAALAVVPIAPGESVPAPAPAPGTAPATAPPAQPFPSAGELLQPRVAVRAGPSRASRVVRVLTRFRPSYHPEVLLALQERSDGEGYRWYQISLPGRPNGGRGWLRADLVDLTPVANRIVVRRGARRLEVRRIADGRLLLRAPIAVGKPSAKTPVGRNFYVRSRFVPANGFLGIFAFETSAYAPISDWPGDGVVGIHGTSVPSSIGKAVSHGCIRLFNRDIAKLRRLAPLGTPIDILP